MDEEDLFFGAGTQNAVLTFQAMQKLPETGLADEATWKALGVGMGGNSAGEHLETCTSTCCSES